MPLTIISIIAGILVSSLWIFLPLKRVPAGIRLGKGKYIASIVIGATACTLVIALLETKFDEVTGIEISTLTTVPKALIYAFLRSALTEEAAKFAFVKMRLKKLKPKGMLQYMLAAGAVGMGYGITEKLMFASAVAMVFDVLFALHVIFQFISGIYLYKADRADSKKQKILFNILAFAVPFIIHGAWDGVLFGTTVHLDSDNMNVTGVVSIVIFIGTVIAALIGEIRMMVYLKKMYAGEEITEEAEIPEYTPEETAETSEGAAEKISAGAPEAE